MLINPPKNYLLKSNRILFSILTLLLLCSLIVFAQPPVYGQSSGAYGPVSSFSIIMNTAPPSGVSFGIWIFAKDSQGNDVTNFTGTVNLTISSDDGGVISLTSGNFGRGQWWQLVTLYWPGHVTVLVNDGNGHTGFGQLDVQPPLPTPTSSPTPTPTQPPTPTIAPTPTVPKLSWLVILLLFFSVFSILVMLRLRKQAQASSP